MTLSLKSDAECRISDCIKESSEAPRQLALQGAGLKRPLALPKLLGASRGALKSVAPLQSARFYRALFTTLVATIISWWAY